MFYHVLIGILFYVVFISKESFGTDVNEILRNPGWERITNVGAKHRFFPNGNASFTGKDLFVSDNPSIDNENSVNTSVGEHNESVKHYMVTHLLACVYVNATVKFVELLKRILEICSRASHNAKNQARYHRNKNKSNGAETSEHSQERPANEEVDLKVSWAVFNFAVLQLTSSGAMFDLMYSPIKYLIDTIPSDKWFDEFTRFNLATLVLPSLKVFKDKSKSINLLLRTYTGENDPEYNEKLGELSYTLSCFINGQVKTALLPFIDQFCIISEPAIPSVSEQIGFFKVNYRKQPTPLEVAYQFAIQISRLVNEEVCKHHYTELGFFYDIGEQTTSFQRPPSPQTLQNVTELQLFI